MTVPDPGVAGDRDRMDAGLPSMAPVLAEAVGQCGTAKIRDECCLQAQKAEDLILVFMVVSCCWTKGGITPRLPGA